MQRASLTSDELALAPPVDDDAASIAAALCDPDIANWIDVIPWPYTLADARHFVREIAVPGWDSGQHPCWVIREKGTTDVIGVIGLTARFPKVYEVGYWLTPAARGQGRATSAVRLVCRYAFETLGAQRIEWQAAVGNYASRAVAERVGIQVEGIARNRLVLDGSPSDSWLGSLLPNDTEPSSPRAMFAEPVELSDRGLTLLSPRSVSEDWVIEAYNDAAIGQWNPADVTDADSARRWIRSRADWTDGTHASWVIAETGTRSPVGAVSLHKINRDNLSASIGYWTIETARGQGFATRAVAMATEWGFAALGLQRIELIHAVANTPSCAVAAANGYSLEGTVQRGEKYGDGKWYDEHIHGRIATRD